jgi:ribosomal protein S12 methylthiotransferase accessory factor
MEMTVSFPGGAAVVADYKGFVIRTDQPVEDGGAGSAPSPYDLFIASLGTCAGFYALRFCQQRQLPTAGMELRVALDRNPESGRLDRVAIDLRLPEGFPARYRTAIVRAVDQCSIKRALLDPPEIVITATEMRP